MIINHVSVGTSDITAAVKFYDAVLAVLSIERSHYIENIAAAYGDNYEFWVGYPYSGNHGAGNGTHIAFNSSSKESVERFHQTAIELGATCCGKPGVRPEYGENYYAAYVLDLDGNKIEAVFLLL
ncbi:VOC family protein [Photobacterium damselae]|uniref:Lactoylglutathione lyase n=3 Tax=Photobacterium damselae TaxID=38293 RepID=E4WLB4_PHODD|nr:VOC family protein [Photobacterium damselae]KAB1184161.1 VOC family protein [Photobacterium damselae subsp. damselae]NVO72883.1 VOC family protein [Photobacterium damselae subsp. damselae]PSB88736.1 VOC family protein [Photobacterium damselae subsp. damselae]QSH59596.1 VOC family protein [Photobacterium damselae subsp. damselae]UKA31852.1 VOC family protein [Photobacterium damselae subsp. damselae]